MDKHPETLHKTICYHCGEDCNDSEIVLEEKPFCCEGCKMVYEIINQNNLCEYYNLDKNPGINQKSRVREGKFDFLENEEIISRLVHFSEGNQKHIIFYLPQMHCSSCIWLLEQLPQVNKGIVHSQVNFLKKEITIVFKSDEISLKKIAVLLTNVGYEPHINLNDFSESKITKYDKSRLYKIGIAGFCFGNIMLLSFPEYFSSGEQDETYLKTIFSYIIVGLSIPVFFYCASEFFISAYKGLKQKFLNIDAPIALAILFTFGRSLFEIFTQTGPGFMDSMSGIVFFMLIGRFFQNKSYQSINFERDYKSYFPIGVSLIQEDGTEKQIPVSQLKKGDRVKIHHQEIIPADGILFLGKANIDYSFVTGESLPVEKSIGEIVYAGGKQTTGAIELEIIKEVSQSYLTQLWNNDVFKKEKNENKHSFIHVLSRYFTYILFGIALISAIYWIVVDKSHVWNAVTAVLIIACPCALLLSATFTNGNMISLLQAQKFYVKNSEVLENISSADTIVFDKTGTISKQEDSKIEFKGYDLSSYQQQLIRTLANQSGHPLSRAIVTSLPFQKSLPIKYYTEETGKGNAAVVNGEYLRLGSAEYVSGIKTTNHPDGTKVFVSINEQVMGYYSIQTVYRKDWAQVIRSLKKRYQLALISGDNSTEEKNLRAVFGNDSELLFNQKPQDKLEYIKQLQKNGRRVIMIGDGLNDSGALRQSNIGIAITDNVNNFSPGSDIILDGSKFNLLDHLLEFGSKEKRIIHGSFILSILYNLVGLTYAVQGNLSPVIAAILMPLSSISIVLYTFLISRFYAGKIRL